MRLPAELSSLSLCKGLRVSNAPAADKNRNIKNFQPTQNVNGVVLITTPVVSCLSSGFGKRGRSQRIHKGIDLFTRTPTAIMAAAPGTVSFVGKQRGYGNIIEIDHSRGVTTRYGHLSLFQPGLKKGSTVKAGEVIGKTGHTGNTNAVHLHYEILVNGKQKNPLIYK